jgi:hypothetical protein
VGDNAIAQHPDPLDFQFDHVARLDEAHMLQPAAVPNSARAEKLARIKRLRARDIRNEILEPPVDGDPTKVLADADNCSIVRASCSMTSHAEGLGAMGSGM